MIDCVPLFLTIVDDCPLLFLEVFCFFGIDLVALGLAFGKDLCREP